MHIFLFFSLTVTWPADTVSCILRFIVSMSNFKGLQPLDRPDGAYRRIAGRTEYVGTCSREGEVV